jgi:Cu/Ag efflux protein CusF
VLPRCLSSIGSERISISRSRGAAIGIVAVALFSGGASAQESHLGIVNWLDEANGTIAITETETGTTGSGAGTAAREFKVQDGLVFNAFKEGDRVSYSVEDIRGVKSITKLEKQ